MGLRPVPEKYPITQTFKQDLTQYNSGAAHGAIDFGTPPGVEAVAINDGTVIRVDDSSNFPGAADQHATDGDWEARLYFLKGGAGNVVVIDHGAYLTTYSHLSAFRVRVGDKVKQGQVVALTGDTGITLGAHLHFEVIPKPFAWQNGFYGRADPAPYITGSYRKTTPTEQTVAKTYKHETQWTTKNQVERSFYGFGPKPTGITLHHFGEPGQKFENVCHFLSTNNVPTSAHYVVEDGRIATLAVPEMATFHCGHTVGNGTTIGIECRPEMDKGDVDTVVQLIFELEQTYGSLNIYQHCDWFNTACAGKWGAKIPEIIDRVNAMHKNGGRDPKLTASTASTATAKPAPKPVVKPQASTPVKPVEPVKKTARQLNPEGWAVWSYKNSDIESRDAYAILRGLAKDVADIKKKLEEK